MLKRYFTLSMLSVIIATHANNSVAIESATSKTLINVQESKIATANNSKIITIDKIVAFVNKNVITSNQLDQQIKQIMLNIQQKGVTLPSEQEIRDKILDQLILQKIQLDLAKKAGIKATDQEVNDAINNIIKTNNTTPDKFKQNLNKQGITFEAFQKQIQDQIIIDKLKQRDVDSRVSVSDEEVNRILDSEAYKNKTDYNLSYIMISIPEQNNPAIAAQKQTQANQAYAALKSGKSFSQVSVQYSNAPNALSGGELGWKSAATLPPQIAAEIAKLKPNEYTSAITLPVGFFIFKLNDIKKHGTPQIVKQYHVRHILIKVNELTSDSEAYHKIMIVKNKLNQDGNDQAKINQDFPKLAQEYSDDTSNTKGGDIGWISKGDTVPAFESAIINTPINTISEPIRSPFGWHIIEVLATRDSNLTDEKEKSEVRQDIRENKSQLLYVQWVRDIREAAYVKINDN